MERILCVGGKWSGSLLMGDLVLWNAGVEGWEVMDGRWDLGVGAGCVIMVSAGEDVGCCGNGVRVCACEVVRLDGDGVTFGMEDIGMRMRNGDMTVKLLDFVGLCGEVPVSLIRKLLGYYDYNRRVVTALVREGYLKERRMKGYHRGVVRSLSLTEAGLRQLRQISPKRAQRVSAHALAPENGHENWKKTLRLHHGAACLLAAMKLDAVWQPGKQKAAALGDRLTYYTAYELASKCGWDNKEGPNCPASL